MFLSAEVSDNPLLPRSSSAEVSDDPLLPRSSSAEVSEDALSPRSSIAEGSDDSLLSRSSLAEGSEDALRPRSNIAEGSEALLRPRSWGKRWRAAVVRRGDGAALLGLLHPSRGVSARGYLTTHFPTTLRGTCDSKFRSFG